MLRILRCFCVQFKSIHSQALEGKFDALNKYLTKNIVSPLPVRKLLELSKILPPGSIHTKQFLTLINSKVQPADDSQRFLSASLASSLSLHHVYNCQWPQAKEWLQKNLQLLMQFQQPSPSLVSRSMIQMAELLILSDDQSLALKYLTDAYEILTQFLKSPVHEIKLEEEQDKLIRILNRLSHVNTIMKRYSQARKYSDLSLQFWKKRPPKQFNIRAYTSFINKVFVSDNSLTLEQANLFLNQFQQLKGHKDKDPNLQTRYVCGLLAVARCHFILQNKQLAEKALAQFDKQIFSIKKKYPQESAFMESFRKQFNV